MTRSLLIISASSLLCGCATLGGTVKGSFDCRAPEGSCAPTTIIDGKVTGAVARTGSPLPPRTSGTGVPRPVRTGERTVTILFPALIDARGVLHEEAVAHAVVEGPDWVTSPDPAAQFSRSPAPSSLREAVAGASAPAIEGLESLPAQAPHPLAPGRPTGEPSQAALDAARAGHRIGQTPVAPLQGPRSASSPGADSALQPKVPAALPASSRAAQQGAESSPRRDELDLSEFLSVMPPAGEPQ